MPIQYIVILTTTPSRDVSLKIARELVRKRLVACVNIVPGIYSVYLWKGNVEEDREELLIMKTRKELINEVIKLIRELHPYEVPEIISLSISEGYEEYLRWINDVVYIKVRKGK